MFYKKSLILSFLFSFFSTLSICQDTGYLDNISCLKTINGLTINFDVHSDYEQDSLGVFVKYVRQEDFIKNENTSWEYSESIPLKNKNSIEFNELNADEVFYFMLALVKRNTTISPVVIDEWSSMQYYENDDRWVLKSGIFIQVLALLGALGLFIYGMKTMSEGIQKGLGKSLRHFIGGMTSNRANGIFFGFLTTSILQSSSATTVMVVSFVNNGLLNLKQSIAVIMGANIGTTITAWLIAYFGFKSGMPFYSLIIFLLAIVLIFSAQSKLRPWGEALIGIALLFFGLEFLSDGIPDVKNTIEQFSFLDSISGVSIWSVALATIVGAVLTIVFQSSIAALILIILLTARGIVPYEMGLGMVLGCNLGTTITANIAAMVGNVHAKRAARAHLLFNLFGVIWMVVLFPFVMEFINWFVVTIFGMNDPMYANDSRPIALALFHTLFNIVNATVLYFFINSISNLVVKLVPTRTDDDETFQLGYIKAGMLSTPEITIIEAKKEVARFGKITSRMSEFFQRLLVETDKKKKEYLYNKIERYEDITDRVEVELTNYLTLTSKNDLTDSTSRKVRSMMAIASYLERIGDVFYQMSITIQRKEKEKIWFSPEQRQNLQKMLVLVDQAFEVMVANLNASSENIDIIKAFKKEEAIDHMRDELRAQHFQNIERKEYNIKSGIIYSDLFYSCEKVGDHIMNITEALVEEEVLDKAVSDFQSEKLKA